MNMDIWSSEFYFYTSFFMLESAAYSSDHLMDASGEVSLKNLPENLAQQYLLFVNRYVQYVFLSPYDILLVRIVSVIDRNDRYCHNKIL